MPRKTIKVHRIQCPNQKRNKNREKGKIFRTKIKRRNRKFKSIEGLTVYGLDKSTYPPNHTKYKSVRLS